jgi:Tfp pilus assembly protein PilF
VALAFCTFVFLATALSAGPASAASQSENVAAYHSVQIENGAPTSALRAQLTYLEAVKNVREGNLERAESQLRHALEFDPSFADPYYTLAWLKLRQFDPEALIFVSNGVVTAWKNFRVRNLFFVNLAVMIPYVTIIMSLIVCFALLIKYLPFAAHKIREYLETRYHAVLPGLSAYLLLALPLLLFPGVITALAYITIVGWMFMRFRERLLVMSLMAVLIAVGLFGSHLRALTPLANPYSLASQIARANVSAGNEQSIRRMERTPAEGLEVEKSLSLGLLQFKRQSYADAADHLFKAISQRPKDPMAYINLGNVYFLRGQYQKALEGYRKAEAIEPTDAICQHALAQAYINTLLMKEASKSLNLASQHGIENIKASYTKDALARSPVFPKTFSESEILRIASVEGLLTTNDFLNETLLPYTRFPRNVSAWILVASLVIAIVLSRIVDSSKLTFQCSNCGKLTCHNCCNDEHDRELCQECAGAVAGVSSEKVIEALLRQKRQAVLVQRRKVIRFLTMLLPGIRDISYGRVVRGFNLAALFSISLVQIFSRGFVVRDVMLIDFGSPMWKLVVPAAGIFVSYMVSMLGRHQLDLRSQRDRANRHRARERRAESSRPSQAA